MTGEREDRQPPAKLGYHLVAFVDLLGQSSALAELRSLPQSEEERRRTAELLKKSVGRVHSIRNTFTDFLAGVSTPSPEMLKQIPADKHAEFLRLRSTVFRQTGFSDTFVASTSLLEPEGKAPAAAANSVNALLWAMAGISLVAMAADVPLRGAVAVGLGCDLLPNEIYGPVLVRAHYLESQIAEYPRIVIDDSVVTYLNYLAAVDKPTDPFGSEIARRVATETRALICEAPDDGLLMAHMLSPSIVARSPNIGELHEPVHAWVREQVSHYRRAGNDKLAQRYGRLLTYFNRHRA